MKPLFPASAGVLVVCEDGAGEDRIAPILPKLLGASPTAFLRLDVVAPAAAAPECGFGADDDATSTALATRRFVRLVQALWHADYAAAFGRVPPDILLSLAADPPRLRALALEAQAAVGRTSRVWCAGSGGTHGPFAWAGAALAWDPREQTGEAIAIV